MKHIERAGYLAHAQTRGYLRKLDQARRLIVAHPDYAVSVSWGKDSSVLLSLSAGIFPEISAINARYGDNERMDDVDDVRDEILARYPQVRYREVRLPGEWEMYEQAGGFFLDATTREQRAAVNLWKREFLAAMQSQRKSMGVYGNMLGLRAEESHARQMNIAKRGISYLRGKEQEPILLPLARWSGRDIWAFLVSQGLPWMRAYDVAPNRSRARGEFCFACGAGGTIRRRGVWLEWREAYPEQFRRWLERFPEIRVLA